MLAAAVLLLVTTDISPAPTEPRPEDWRRLADRSAAVVAATVTKTIIDVVRPERMTERVFDGPDGRRRVVPPEREAYLEGSITRFHVDEVFKADARAAVGRTLEVFFAPHGYPPYVEGERYLLFLENPIEKFETLRQEERDWRDLYGTALKSPWEPLQPFNVAAAYQLSIPGGGSISTQRRAL